MSEEYWKGRCEVAENERDVLSDQMHDYKEDRRKILRDKCGKDETHCSCVPDLRKRIKDLELALQMIADKTTNTEYFSVYDAAAIIEDVRTIANNATRIA